MSIGWGLTVCLVLLAVGLAIPRVGSGIATAASVWNVLLGLVFLYILIGTIRLLSSPEHPAEFPGIFGLLLMVALGAAVVGVYCVAEGSRSRLFLLFACAAPAIGLAILAYGAAAWPQLWQPPRDPGARITSDVEFLAWLLLPAILTLREYFRTQ
jgi:hypothetical protein